MRRGASTACSNPVVSFVEPRLGVNGPSFDKAQDAGERAERLQSK